MKPAIKPAKLLRRLALWAALALCCVLCALPAAAETDLSSLAPYAEDGDFDYIRSYVVTVALRADGSADITYDIDWQVIGGSRTDYLSWVKIGLPNAHAEDLTPLTDTIADLQYTDDGGSYAKVVFAHRYYAPDIAAENGGESSVRFAFTVHQSHLFTLNDDGTASFDFTPGWFDELCVEHMQIRWLGTDLAADNTGTDGAYLTWDFGPLGHGQAGEAQVTVPAASAEAFDPDAALSSDDYGGESSFQVPVGEVLLGVMLVFILVIFVLALVTNTPAWQSAYGEDADDWFWYTDGLHTIHRPRGAPPPQGYRRAEPPADFRMGGGKTRGGGVGRHRGSGGSSHSCACACASSCACACACAGGGRAGCSAKDFYTVTLPRKAETEDDR